MADISADATHLLCVANSPLRHVSMDTKGINMQNNQIFITTAAATAPPPATAALPPAADFQAKFPTFGVADGVGGYAKDGIDSGIYAHELMENAWNFVLDHGAGLDPMDVLKHAFDRSEAAGASTACIMSLKDGFLQAVNVGDSGFFVIRSGKIVYKSPVQQIYFNCPFQLGGRNTHSDGDKIVFEVEKGDTVVAATDGLLDNVFLDEIEFDVKTSLESWCSPEETALSLDNLARKLSLIDDEARPFTVAGPWLDWNGQSTWVGNTMMLPS